MKRSEIAAVLASAGLRPQHQFGQNFMVDQNILGLIADAGEIGEEDVVLEVGPGVGNLTRVLAEKAKRGAVLAVDIDRKLLPAAERHHAGLGNIAWMNADVLAGKHEINGEVIAKLRELRGRFGGELKLVSNLPYNAASPIVAELLVMMWGEMQGDRGEGKGERGLLFSRLAFTVQWEVAERMRAVPDTSDYGPLGILIQLMAEVEIVRKIPPGAFWPPPKVNSALVVVRPSVEKMGRIGDVLALQGLLTGVFGHRRQTLHNGLRHYLGEKYTAELQARIGAAGIDLKVRPEVIPLESFLTLAKNVAGG